MAAFVHKAHGHTKISDCGCRVCLVPGMNATAKGQPEPAHMRALERFHAYIHKIEAKRRARKRLAGDGRVEADGEFIRTARLERELYEKRLVEWKAAKRRVPAANRLEEWLNANRLDSTQLRHMASLRKGGEESHYVSRFYNADGVKEWGNYGTVPIKRCAECRSTIRKAERFEAQARKRAAAIGAELTPSLHVADVSRRAPMKPSEPRPWSSAGDIPKSKFVGPRKRIPAGYRPRKRREAA